MNLSQIASLKYYVNIMYFTYYEYVIKFPFLTYGKTRVTNSIPHNASVHIHSPKDEDKQIMASQLPWFTFVNFKRVCGIFVKLLTVFAGNGFF